MAADGSVAAALWFALARAGKTPGAIRLVPAGTRTLDENHLKELSGVEADGALSES